MPKPLTFEPGSSLSGQDITPCTTDLIQDKIGAQCTNKERSYKNVQLLLNFGDFTLHLARSIGQAHITCPIGGVQWTTFQDDINIFILHHSCGFLLIYLDKTYEAALYVTAYISLNS